MSRTLLAILLLAALSYGAICLVVFLFQRSLIYFPEASPAHPEEATLVLPIEEGTVRVGTRFRKGAKAVLYFGGNAEDVSLTRPELESSFPQHALYLMHYRGYGGSSGTPSEAGLRADALALFDGVLARHASIVVIGRSLGSGIAVWLASVRQVAGLVLVTPYASLEELARSRYPFLPVRWLLRDRFESWRFAPQVSAPTLLLVAEHDSIIPRQSSQALQASFRPGIASLQIIAGTDHNSISASVDYMRALASFR